MTEEGSVTFKFLNQTLVLSPNKTLYWKEQRMLIISDVHLGKASHFRKSGIAVPADVHLTDQYRIEALIQIYDPLKVVFLGDLFHSEHNLNWPIFCTWLDEQIDVQFTLVKGNHDILPVSAYEDSVLIVVDKLDCDPFTLTHEQEDSTYYNISGHVHPSVKLKGSARQSLVLPCFYFGNDYALLPAFGTFTGFIRIPVSRTDKVFALTDSKVIAVT